MKMTKVKMTTMLAPVVRARGGFVKCHFKSCFARHLSHHLHTRVDVKILLAGSATSICTHGKVYLHCSKYLG